MNSKLLEQVKWAIAKKGVPFESIKVYRKHWDADPEEECSTLIVVNDKYEFHFVGGFRSNFKDYARRPSLVLLNRLIKWGLETGSLHFPILDTESVCYFDLIETITPKNELSSLYGFMKGGETND